jgi:hypothetical protein
MRLVSPIIQNFLERGYCRDYTDQVSDRFKIITIPFNASGYYKLNTDRMYFPSDTQLSSCWIRGLAVLSNAEQVSITDSEGFLVDALAASIFPRILITVCDSKRQIIAQIAAQSCYQAANNGKICFTDFPDMNIGNSYITVSDDAGIGFATCFALKVYYDLQVPVKNEQN